MAENQRPIRVMRIIARLNVGGPAIHVTLLTQKLDPASYETMLVCGMIEQDEGDMRYFAEERGVNPVVIPGLRREINLRQDFGAMRHLIRLMREYRPDVVHTHTAKAGFLGRLAARLTGVPVVVHTFHGHVFHGYFGFFKTQLFIWLERLAARMSDTIITLTESLRRELAEDYHITRRGRITVLPLGLDLKVFSDVPRHQGHFRTRWKIAKDALVIGIVGRLVPVKNHPLFFEAAVRVRETLPNAHFVVVGDGEERFHSERVVDELGLRGSVTFTGWQRDLASIYSDLDLVVISSKNEGTPVSIIEALSAAVPVVATQVGGMYDLLEGGRLGRLVQPNDPDALAAAIVETLQDTPDPAPAQAAMLERYGIARLVSDLEGLYRGLLTRKGGLRS